jgi:hypothetical protein
LHNNNNFFEYLIISFCRYFIPNKSKTNLNLTKIISMSQPH